MGVSGMFLLQLEMQVLTVTWQLFNGHPTNFISARNDPK